MVHPRVAHVRVLRGDRVEGRLGHASGIDVARLVQQECVQNLVARPLLLVEPAAQRRRRIRRVLRRTVRHDGGRHELTVAARELDVAHGVITRNNTVVIRQGAPDQKLERRVAHSRVGLIICSHRLGERARIVGCQRRQLHCKHL